MVVIKRIHPAEANTYVSTVVSLIEQLSRRPVDRDRVLRSLQNPQVYNVAAFRNGVVIGYANGCRLEYCTDTVLYVNDVVVDVRARNGGVGSKLIRQLIEHARYTGCDAVDLRSSRKVAKHMYASLGFAVLPTEFFRLQL